MAKLDVQKHFFAYHTSQMTSQAKVRRINMQKSAGEKGNIANEQKMRKNKINKNL